MKDQVKMTLGKVTIVILKWRNESIKIGDLLQVKVPKHFEWRQQLEVQLALMQS